MKVFVTGATGFIGRAIVKELLTAGHQVLGLARSDSNAEALIAAGADVHRGSLEDLDSLRSAAAACDGVIHAGFIHDFTRFAEVCEIDRIAIMTIGEVLVGTKKPFVVTSGTALVRPGSLATEDMIPVPGGHPRLSEVAADALASLGVNVSSVRLSPSVHGEEDHHGFVPMLINIAKEKGSAAYIGDGQNRWNAVHRLDAAKLFRLALENSKSGERFHATAEPEIFFKTIAESIGKHLGLPVVSVSAEDAATQFGWFAGFAGLDCPASSELTQERLDWHPVGPTLSADMEQGMYFQQ